MPANRRTVTPESGGGWTVTGGTSGETYPSQFAAETAAKEELLATGGGELLLKGKDGRVREQNTIGRPDPRSSKG